ncbi:glycerophosphoryl diester phosphodiesterase membrane domain-containing protein [Streptacidiphilus sp. EB129]|uniref:glycerophosphoryl diester phosphodiesterase membrane domain-containing protein n=1 Tax=Streptacidiphilus sp. EB129 TaxID=3156262 RepID=UPI0035183795
MPLRPLDANDIVKGVFATVRRYFGPLYLPLLAVVLGSTVLLSGCVYVAWKLVTRLHLHGERMTTGRVVDAALAAAVVVVPALFCAAFAYAVTTAVSITVLGHHAVLGQQPLTARQAWREARPHLWRTLGTQLLTVLVVIAVLLVSALPAVVLGVALHSGTAAAFGLLGLIPGSVGMVYVGGRLFFAAPVTVLEGMRPTDAMRRSWQLNRGAWWRTFGVMLLPGMVGRAATQVITGGGDTVAAQYAPPGLLTGTQSGLSLHLSAAGLVLPVSIIVLAIIAAAIIRAPLTPLTLGLLYIDRCIRKERLHITLVAAAGGAVSHAPFPLLPLPPKGPPPKLRREQAGPPGDGLPPYGNQQPARGRRMIGAGWVLRIVGTGVGLTGLQIFEHPRGAGCRPRTGAQSEQ